MSQGDCGAKDQPTQFWKREDTMFLDELNKPYSEDLKKAIKYIVNQWVKIGKPMGAL